MVESNPDGSLKLPGSVMKSREETANRMRNQRCIRIRRDVVNFTAPKKCVLTLTLSDAITDSRFVENIFNDYKQRAKTPMKLIRISNKEFQIEIGTDFLRCSECTAIRGLYREFLDGNFIDDKGNCTYEKMVSTKNSFAYEDYFD